jgi:hypothetical protein
MRTLTSVSLLCWLLAWQDLALAQDSARDESGALKMSEAPAQALTDCPRRSWKHSRQKTGRPCVGLNGTVVSLPQCEQTVRVSARGKLPFGWVAPNTAKRFVLQALHRLGGFLNCLSWKNDCSPAVNKKSAPQSMHCNCLSRNSIEEMLPSFHSPAISVCSEEVGHAARTEAQELGSSPSIVLKTTLDSAHHTSEVWTQR